jgi:hypothetical protein
MTTTATQKFTRGQQVTCNGNTEAVVQDYYMAGMVNVRLWQGMRHVGDVCVPESDLIRENKLPNTK